MYKLTLLPVAMILTVAMHIGGTSLTPAHATLPKLPSARARHLPVRHAPVVEEKRESAVQTPPLRAEPSETLLSQQAQFIDRRRVLNTQLDKLGDNILRFISMNHALDIKLKPYHVRKNQLDADNATLRANGTYATLQADLNNEFASTLALRAQGGDLLNRLRALETSVAANFKLLEVQEALSLKKTGE